MLPVLSIRSSTHHGFQTLQCPQGSKAALCWCVPGIRLKSIMTNFDQVAVQKVADPIVSEHFAKAGLGVVLIDQQHGRSPWEITALQLDAGLLDERTSFECLQRLEKFPACFPMVRVADNTPALIRFLVSRCKLSTLPRKFASFSHFHVILQALSARLQAHQYHTSVQVCKPTTVAKNGSKLASKEKSIVVPWTPEPAVLWPRWSTTRRTHRGS